jgi:enoyl-CoA hydratase/carnithine racemase
MDETARQLAHEIAANAPLTIHATKEMLRRIGEQRRLPAGADRDLVELCYTSADFREGISAFLAKRPPEWTGR